MSKTIREGHIVQYNAMILRIIRATNQIAHPIHQGLMRILHESAKGASQPLVVDIFKFR